MVKMRKVLQVLSVLLIVVLIMSTMTPVAMAAGGNGSGGGSGSGSGGGKGGGSGSGTGGGGGNNPLNVEGVYVSEIAIAEAEVTVGEQPEIQVAFTRGMTENFEANKNEISLYSDNDSQIEIDIYMKNDKEEQGNMYVKPVRELTEGEFTLKLSKNLKANNGNTLGNGESFMLLVKAEASETDDLKNNETEKQEDKEGKEGKEGKENQEAQENQVDTSFIGRDIAENHWAKETIEHMISQGLITGDADTGNVRPVDHITRQELASLLVRALKLEVATGSDLMEGDPSSAWAADMLGTLKKSGIMKGDNKGYLNGQAQATRLEVIVMLARAQNLSSANMSVYDTFSDTLTIPSWAKMPVAGLIEKGLLKGYPDNTLRLDEAIVRAEVFSLIDRIIE